MARVRKRCQFKEGPQELEIAHVLFMDIVSYSLLPIDHQTEVITELQDLVRSLPEFEQAKANDQVVSLPTGDGMALAFFGDPTFPLRCAESIGASIRDSGRLKLRMGIHTGPVYRLADINANLNLAGGGINFAQRVMDIGDAGHILVSRAAAETLLQLSRWKSAIHDLGEFQVKHGVVVHVYNAYADSFGMPQCPTKMQTSESRVQKQVTAKKADTPDGNDITGARADDAAIANPFDPWTPAIPPAFVGRATLLARLQAALEEGRSISLVGDWRIGKSSLLKTCLLRLERSGRTARLLSGENREGASPSLFVECATGKVPKDSADAAADTLAHWARQAGKPGLIPTLLIDEFDILVVRFDPRFFERLRGMLDYLSVVVSSRRELDRIYKDLGRASPFHNRLELYWLGLLEQEAAEKLTRRSEQVVSQEAQAMVREWAGRHPFFIQLFGRKLVDSIRYGESLEDAKDHFWAEGGSRLRELWSTLSERDQATLRDAVHQPQPNARSLRQRGLLSEDGRPFGRLLVDWLQENSG